MHIPSDWAWIETILSALCEVSLDAGKVAAATAPFQLLFVLLSAV